MNNHSYISSLLKMLLITATLLSACATIATPAPPTDTPKPLDVPILSHSPELILATNKPPRKALLLDRIVYTTPEMDEVLLASELTYYKDLKVDIYYPPDYDFGTKLPIVILAHGFQEYEAFWKDVPQHIDWAELIATSGMIAVSAQSSDAPMGNMYHLLDYLGANADVLGIDLTRIGFWAISGHGGPVFKAVQDKNLSYRNAFKAGLFLYLDLDPARPEDWPENLSLFVVKAGKDDIVPAKTIDSFVSEARSMNIPTEYVELPDAIHGFDALQDTQTSKDTIKQALDFLVSKLLP